MGSNQSKKSAVNQQDPYRSRDYGRSTSSGSSSGVRTIAVNPQSPSNPRSGYAHGNSGYTGGGGGSDYGSSRPVTIDRSSPDGYLKILDPVKSDKRMKFDPNIPRTLTPKGYAKLKMMMSVASKQYQMLVSKLNREGKLWEDEDFPANDTSIQMDKLRGQIQWKRPKEIIGDAEYFVDGPSRFDIEQGQLGDCWLLAVVSTISSYPALYDHVLPKEQKINSPQYCGVFRARFWRFGQWVEVLVDDRLPVMSGTNQLVFMHSNQTNEFWSALLEKAYAKLCGCYNHLSGGTQAEAMEDLTGGVCQTLNITPDKRKPDLAQEMMRFSKHCCLMGCSIESAVIEARLAQGLIAGHAYSVTGVATVGYRGMQQVLVRCRNPWGGSYEWTGPWADNSSEWNLVSDADKRRIHLEFRADGEFWMAFEDFVSRFTQLEVCHLGLDSLEEGDAVRGKLRLEESIFSGKWEQKISAGGCINYRASYWMNPQFRITLVDPDPEDDDGLCSLYIGVMQKDVRKEGKPYLTIGFMIYQVDEKQTALLSRAQLMTRQPIGKSSFTNSREVCNNFRLQPGNYIVIPSTFEPNEEGHFIVRMLTAVKAEEHELDDTNANTGLPDKVMQAVELENLTLNEDEDMRNKFKEIMNPSTKTINAIGLKNLLDSSSLQDVKGYESFDKETCRSLVASVDYNQTGTLDENEFMDLWIKAKAWKTVYMEHDADNSGSFDDSEFREALTDMGYSVSQRLFNSLVHRYQDPGTSRICFADFLLCAIRLRNAFETVAAHPKNVKGTILFSTEDYLRFSINI